MIAVDEPSLSLTIGINTSPLAGREGNRLTARQIKDRLDQELVGNVSLRVELTERPDSWEVQGRGELQLAVLVETMRREGFELTVGKPQVLTREIDGVVHEPLERASIDMPGGVPGRRDPAARAAQGAPGADREPRHRLGADGVPRARPRAGRLPHRVPDRDARHRPAAPRLRPLGARGRGRSAPARAAAWWPTARRTTTSFALFGLQERGTLFVGPGEDVYEGAIVGENGRGDDLDVNPTKEKKLTNMRVVHLRRAGAAGAAAARAARHGARVRARRRVRGGRRPGRCGCARSS